MRLAIVALLLALALGVRPAQAEWTCRDQAIYYIETARGTHEFRAWLEREGRWPTRADTEAWALEERTYRDPVMFWQFNNEKWDAEWVRRYEQVLTALRGDGC